jgi:hypothetical protein
MRPAIQATALGFLSLLLVASGAAAYSGGPPNARTGAPGESTCADCHGNLNVGPGYASASGPATFLPGETLDIYVEVAHDGQQRWGFEITALDGSDQPVGQFVLVEPARTQLATEPGTGRQYAKQTAAGTDLGTPDVSPGWTVRWASPADPIESVTFYVAGNAADGNGSTSGDFIYTGSLHYDDTQTAIAEDVTTWGRLKALFR